MKREAFVGSPRLKGPGSTDMFICDNIVLKENGCSVIVNLLRQQ